MMAATGFFQQRMKKKNNDGVLVAASRMVEQMWLIACRVISCILSEL
jgi:hypothetical protein